MAGWDITPALAALKAHFDSSTVGASYKLYLFEAPPSKENPKVKVSSPYFTYMSLPFDTGLYMSGISTQVGVVQFMAFSDSQSAVEAGTMGNLLMADFNRDTTLAITGQGFVSLQKGSSNLIKDPDRGWNYQVDYRIMVEETA